MTTTNDRTKPEVAPDTLANTPALRKSVLITCASMTTVVLTTLLGIWQTRQMIDAFAGSELPFSAKVAFVLTLACLGVVALAMAVGMVLYILAALPVLARARQRSIERLLSAQAWLWGLMGVSIAGLLCMAILAKILSFFGSLSPF